ncbi:hypothetical protein HPB48_010972 [Haemaphysalis longicornis]|uniref:Uncharacterized protein n=1 Tax=Haemaphysalis longicornis TaxID=44386 RepID=A0A9J6GR54_HAELO|nr:hypothetical protein HPB48_010972 [Haemaphysalis longicornis]
MINAVVVLASALAAVLVGPDICRIEAWTSALSLVGPSVHLNLVDTALLRTYTGVSSSRIRAGVSLHTLSAAELGRSGESYDPAGSRSDPRAALLELLTDVNAYWGVLACVSFGLLAGSFAVLPSVEVYNDARRMQLMTGVSPLVYLGTHFLFDLLFYLLPMTAIYVGFALLKQLSARSAGPGVTIAYLLGKDFDRDPRLLFTFFPPFAISAATIRTVNLDFEEATCHYIRRQKVDRDMQRFCQDVKRVGSAIMFCCDSEWAVGVARPLLAPPNLR